MNRLLKLLCLMKEEMKRTVDIDLLEKIFDMKSVIRTEFDLCTCSSAVLRRTSSNKTVEIAEFVETSREEISDSGINFVHDEIRNEMSMLTFRYNYIKFSSFFVS